MKAVYDCLFPHRDVSQLNVYLCDCYLMYLKSKHHIQEQIQQRLHFLCRLFVEAVAVFSQRAHRLTIRFFFKLLLAFGHDVNSLNVPSRVGQMSSSNTPARYYDYVQLLI